MPKLQAPNDWSAMTVPVDGRAVGMMVSRRGFTMSIADFTAYIARNGASPPPTAGVRNSLFEDTEATGSVRSSTGRPANLEVPGGEMAAPGFTQSLRIVDLPKSAVVNAVSRDLPKSAVVGAKKGKTVRRGQVLRKPLSRNYR